jgi:hypothetical protein
MCIGGGVKRKAWGRGPTLRESIWLPCSQVSFSEAIGVLRVAGLKLCGKKPSARSTAAFTRYARVHVQLLCTMPG